MLLEGESRAEFEALEAWWFEQYDGTGECRPLLEEAALNEWLLQRTQRSFLQVERGLSARDAGEWTAEDLHRLGLMLRYKTAAERSFHRSMAAVERFRRTRVYEELAQARRKQPAEEEQDDPAQRELEEQEAKWAEVVVKPALTQYVWVDEVDGNVVTTLKPTNEELRAQLAVREPKAERIFRRLTFWMGDVPPEYAWVQEQLPARSNARQQVMVPEEWLWAVEREKGDPSGHVGPVEADPSWDFGTLLEGLGRGARPREQPSVQEPDADEVEEPDAALVNEEPDEEEPKAA